MKKLTVLSMISLLVFGCSVDQFDKPVVPDVLTIPPVDEKWEALEGTIKSLNDVALSSITAPAVGTSTNNNAVTQTVNGDSGTIAVQGTESSFSVDIGGGSYVMTRSIKLSSITPTDYLKNDIIPTFEKDGTVDISVNSGGSSNTASIEFVNLNQGSDDILSNIIILNGTYNITTTQQDGSEETYDITFDNFFYTMNKATDDFSGSSQTNKIESYSGKVNIDDQDYQFRQVLITQE